MRENRLDKLSRKLSNPRKALEDLDRFDSEQSLMGYIRAAWSILEPGRKFKEGWHLEAVCEHLEAVTTGQINRLLINVPPGTMKSLTTEVFWPSWEWGPKDMAWKRYISFSYSADLTLRDNRKTRMLIESEWYKNLWGDNCRLVSDQNAKVKFETHKRGFKLASSIGGVGTGERADTNIVDDPHNVKEGESIAKREGALLWFTETLPTRMNDPESSAIVVIMQRVHESDVSGYILSNELGYEHLMLPMEYEADRRCHTCIGFKDPRTKDGELLWPAHMPSSVIERDKHVMGAYAVAGQFQQRPVPRGGGLFQRDWFKRVSHEPRGGQEVRAWDLAATAEKTKHRLRTSYTVGLRMKYVDGNFYICNVHRGRWSEMEVEEEILEQTQNDGLRTRISIPQDPGQAGKAQVKRFSRLLVGYDVRFSTETGSKEIRALGLSAQAEAGNVYLVDGLWVEAFLSEICVFPMSAIKDQVDASSRAFMELTSMTNNSLFAEAPEIIEPEDEDELVY